MTSTPSTLAPTTMVWIASAWMMSRFLPLAAPGANSTNRSPSGPRNSFIWACRGETAPPGMGPVDSAGCAAAAAVA